MLASRWRTEVEPRLLVLGAESPQGLTKRGELGHCSHRRGGRAAAQPSRWWAADATRPAGGAEADRDGGGAGAQFVQLGVVTSTAV
eukprot:SAG11_NODE_2184_length_3711_cov_6.483942_1_plen_86_part_00